MIKKLNLTEQVLIDRLDGGNRGSRIEFGSTYSKNGKETTFGRRQQVALHSLLDAGLIKIDEIWNHESTEPNGVRSEWCTKSYYLVYKEIGESEITPKMTNDEEQEAAIMWEEFKREEL